MDAQEFFDRFIGLYKQARVPTFPDDAIRRGRCRSVSGGLEDLLAFFIAKNVPAGYMIYVDQNLNLGKRLAMYPDITLLARDAGEVRHFIDAKTDLGWNRDKLRQICQKLADQATIAKTIPIELVSHNGEASKYKVAANAKCHLVIGTRVNSGSLDADHISEVTRATGVAIYILSETKHPNLFSKTEDSKYPASCIVQAEVDRLINALRLCAQT